jgi:hypothetical protein
MSGKWIKTQYPGVRYYEHNNLKYNNKRDRYFSIRYKKSGRTVEEAAGWASSSMNAQKASFMRGEIVQNIRESMLSYLTAFVRKLVGHSGNELV